MRLAVVALAPIVATATATPATAAPGEPEPIRLEYVAPAGCPNAEAFFAQLQQRARATRVEAATARSFRIEIEPDGDGFTGQLEVSAGDGQPAVRDVHGATCAETVLALALVSALAIEERAAVRAAPAPTRAPAPAPARPWHVAVGTGVEVDSGLATDTFVLPLFAHVRRDGGWQFRLELAASQRFDVTTPDGRGKLGWEIGVVDVCAPGLARGRWSASPCVGVQAGVLSVTGSDVAMATTADRPWLAPEAGLRGRVAIGRFALELAGIVAAPLVRDRFYIAPSTTVEHVPAVTGGVQLAISLDLR